MKMYKYAIRASVLIALAIVVLVGCGVNSGVRDENTPGYTGGPASGTPGGSREPGSTPAGSDPGDATEVEKEIFKLVNEEREKAGVGQLTWCDGLAELARAHSCDMCDRNFFDHTNPEGEGPNDRAKAGHAGSYTFEPLVPNPYWGVPWENIAMGQTSAQEVMTDWMNSSGHRANILNGGHTHIGVGVCKGCGRHFTQNFGQR